jgi:outer membrane immunogenic protein
MSRVIGKLIFSTGVIAALAAGGAGQGLAADLPVRAAYVPAFTWAGLYAGAHLGYIWNDPELVASSFTSLVGPGEVVTNAGISPPGSLNDTSGHRFVGGGQLGFNMQTGIWVYGAEADISAGRRRIGTNASSNFNFLSNPVSPVAIQNLAAAEAEVDWYGTVRGRLGIARDRWLVYASGGLAYGQVKVSTVSNPFVFIVAADLAVGTTAAATTTHTKAGWAANAGVAYAWSDTVSLFAEWTRINLGGDTAQTNFFVPINTGGVSFQSRSDVVNRFDVIQAGVNLKIN